MAIISMGKATANKKQVERAARGRRPQFGDGSPRGVDGMHPRLGQHLAGVALAWLHCAISGYLSGFFHLCSSHCLLLVEVEEMVTVEQPRRPRPNESRPPPGMQHHANQGKMDAEMHGSSHGTVLHWQGHPPGKPSHLHLLYLAFFVLF